MKNKISISIHGEITTHIAADNCSNYATLCGLDGDDIHPTVNQKIVDSRNKIDCSACYEIWKQCLSYTPKDFSIEIRRNDE